MRFKKFIKTEIFAVIILLTMFVAVYPVSAALLNNKAAGNIDNQAQSVGAGAGYDMSTDKNSALILVQTIISIFLSVIGVLLLVYILYAGYNWLTAQGEEEKVSKAKDTIKRAIIGVIIIIAAYAISVFVMSRIEAGTLENTDGEGTGVSTPI